MDDKEQLKKEVSAILGISDKYDLRERSNVSKIKTYYETKVALTTSVGRKYLERLNALEAGETNCSCIICKNNIADDGVICSACMNRLSSGKRTIYCNREKDEQKSHSENDQKNENVLSVKDRSDNKKSGKAINLHKLIPVSIVVLLIVTSFFAGKYVGENYSYKKTDSSDEDVNKYTDAFANVEQSQDPAPIDENKIVTDENKRLESLGEENNESINVQEYSDPHDYGEENYDADDYDYGEENYDADDYDYGKDNYDADDFDNLYSMMIKDNSGKIEGRYSFPTIVDSGGTLENFQLDYFDQPSGAVDEDEALNIVNHFYPQSEGWKYNYLVIYNSYCQTTTCPKIDFWTALGYEREEAERFIGTIVIEYFRTYGNIEEGNKWSNISEEGLEQQTCYLLNATKENLYDGNMGYVGFRVNTDGRVLVTGNIFQDSRYTNGYYRIR